MIEIREANRIARERMTPRRRWLYRLLLALLFPAALLLWVLPFLPYLMG